MMTPPPDSFAVPFQCPSRLEPRELVGPPTHRRTQERTEFTGTNSLASPFVKRDAAQRMRDVELLAGFDRCGEDLITFGERRCQRLLADYVLARLERGNDDVGVTIVRR